MSISNELHEIYNRLFRCYGPQHWWPADEPFEVCIGAILTQSTAWINVEKAIANLKEAGALNPASIREMPPDGLAELIRPSGYYNAKARKLRAFVNRLKSHDDSLEALFAATLPQLRQELLSIYGIGPETADSIILYAACKPAFVIDAYTHRIMDRLGLNPDYGDYTELQAVFTNNLPANEPLFNEYHALFVRHGKEICKKAAPLCQGCCLGDMCYFK
jgi:endonuclease-3 related protein